MTMTFRWYHTVLPLKVFIYDGTVKDSQRIIYKFFVVLKFTLLDWLPLAVRTGMGTYYMYVPLFTL